mgnify:CR=1 FL=1
MKKSIVLPAFFKESINNIDCLLNSINIVKQYGFSVVELYFEGNNKKIIKDQLKKEGLTSIYLGAAGIKKYKLNLASLDKDLRQTSVEEVKKYIEDAYYFGARAILINSGKKTVDKQEELLAYQALKNSLKELLKFNVKKSDDYLLDVHLETGDTEIESFELIGNTELAVKFVKDMHEKYSNIFLTLDTSHLRQLGEDPLTSIKKAFKYCKHIHLANCVLDKGSPLYGDKHPRFGEENGEFDLKNIRKIYKSVCSMYEGHQLIITLEIICREDDPIEFFKQVVNEMSW